LLPGYNIRILDGNHFAATEHRLLETRRETAAPLAGNNAKPLIVCSARSRNRNAASMLPSAM